MKYTKPHLPYDQQLALLRERGLVVSDPPRALRDLKRIGYYRLSGYLYPMREIQHPEPGQRGGRPHRLNSFATDAHFEDAVALHDFDHRLRGVLMDGLQQLEVGLRVKVGYTLGKRGALAHLNPDNLGPNAQKSDRRSRNMTRYQTWRQEYDSHQRKAKSGKHELTPPSSSAASWRIGWILDHTVRQVVDNRRAAHRSRHARAAAAPPPTNTLSWSAWHAAGRPGRPAR